MMGPGRSLAIRTPAYAACRGPYEAVAVGRLDMPGADGRTVAEMEKTPAMNGAGLFPVREGNGTSYLAAREPKPGHFICSEGSLGEKGPPRRAVRSRGRKYPQGHDANRRSGPSFPRTFAAARQALRSAHARISSLRSVSRAVCESPAFTASSTYRSCALARCCLLRRDPAGHRRHGV